jgi:hypothetical protein
VFDNKHWASDVAFGAVGMTCGRTVTIHPPGCRAVLQPDAVPGGGVIVAETSR